MKHNNKRIENKITILQIEIKNRRNVMIIYYHFSYSIYPFSIFQGDKRKNNKRIENRITILQIEMTNKDETE